MLVKAHSQAELTVSFSLPGTEASLPALLPQDLRKTAQDILRGTQCGNSISPD